MTGILLAKPGARYGHLGSGRYEILASRIEAPRRPVKAQRSFFEETRPTGQGCSGDASLLLITLSMPTPLPAQTGAPRGRPRR